jgi:prepilin-type N-terminal cleavage/methylation domain-containing protein
VRTRALIHRSGPVRRSGVTLVELLVALTLFGALMAGALSMLRGETRRFQLGGERAAIYQNGRFALNEMEKDLRTSGAGAPDMQPQLVFVGDSVLVFNANYWSNTPGDVEAVYISVDAPDSAVSAMRPSGRIVIPYSGGLTYPDTSYTLGGINSPAETITFYFRGDSSTTRTDDYILWRRINNLSPEVVSTNILRTPNEPFFRYFRRELTGSTVTLSAVPMQSLPWRHERPIHLASNDTGIFARIDSIRAVRVSFTVTNGRLGSAAGEQTRALTRFIRLPNSGLSSVRTCGDAPIFTSTIVVQPGMLADSTRFARISFAPSVDELSGERDVERYIIWRRFGSATDWPEPLTIIPAGDSLHVYIDRTVLIDSTYRYGVAAQDCTPTRSQLQTSNAVRIP